MIHLDHLFAQSDLTEYARLDQQEEETKAAKDALRAKFIAAAEKAKADGIEITAATEPGSLRVTVALGEKDSTSYKEVISAIEERNCFYSNGGSKMVQLNTVLPSIIAGKTKPVPNNRVTVKTNIR